MENRYTISLYENNSPLPTSKIYQITNVKTTLGISRLYRLYQNKICKSRNVQLVKKFPVPAQYYTIEIKSRYGIFNEFVIDFEVMNRNSNIAKRITTEFINLIKSM